ncbi:hypothetical protein F4814DRAFT_459216 [Daldinia grandis]|nr:hypothetical protein F4814DRAFT_459216 [Daldinia grandis]
MLSNQELLGVVVVVVVVEVSQLRDALTSLPVRDPSCSYVSDEAAKHGSARGPWHDGQCNGVGANARPPADKYGPDDPGREHDGLVWIPIPPAAPMAEARFNCVRVLSGGIMVGAAMLLPAFQHEEPFYQYLILCLFGISTFVHNTLIWEAVVNYFFLALATTVAVIFITIPHSSVSVSFLLGRTPLLISLMSLFVENCSRRFNQNSRYRKKAHDLKLIPPGVESDTDGRSLHVLGHHDELFSYMNGGEMRQYNVLSQHSSEISLSNLGPGRLPSSCDSMIRDFWRDESGSLSECKKEERQGEKRPDLNKTVSFW